MREKIIRFIINLLFPKGNFKITKLDMNDGSGIVYDLEQLGNEKYGDLLIIRFRIVGLPEEKK